LLHRLVGEAADLLEISALDPDQPSRTVAARRMQIALVVEMGDTRRQRIFLDQPHLARLVLAGGLEQLPVAHHRLAPRLTVNCPARAVIVRQALPRAVVDMAQNAEPELRVLVKDLALGHAVVEMRGDEIFVLEHLLNQRADLLAALDPRLLRQDTVTLTGELLESIAH